MKITVCLFLVLFFVGCGDKKSTDNSENAPNPAPATSDQPGIPATTPTSPSLTTPPSSTTPPPTGQSPSPSPAPSPAPSPTPAPTTGTGEVSVDYYKDIVTNLIPTLNTNSGKCIFYPLTLLPSVNLKYLSSNGYSQYDVRFNLFLLSSNRYILAYQKRDGYSENWYQPSFFTGDLIRDNSNQFKLASIADGTINVTNNSLNNKVIEIKFKDNILQDMTIVTSNKIELAMQGSVEKNCNPGDFSKSMTNFGNVLYSVLEPSTY